jgi:Selenoprotein, putative
VSARAWTGLQRLWRLVREWSGDLAYETYLGRCPPGDPSLSRQAFYLDSLRRKYSGPSRCC